MRHHSDSGICMFSVEVPFHIETSSGLACQIFLVLMFCSSSILLWLNLQANNAKAFTKSLGVPGSTLGSVTLLYSKMAF